MNNIKHKAFTLVELIVVVTILAILATIGFVSYSSYLTGVRDTNRLAQLVSIHDGLELYRTRNDLPLPDDNVEVQTNGETIAYQGYAGVNTLETIDFTKGGQDPRDGSYFTYYLTDDRRYFQLMGFLEEEAGSVGYNELVSGTYAVSYENRIPTVYGRKLGVLTDDINTPIQEVSTVTADGFLDLNNVGSSVYKAYLSEEEIIKGNGTAISLSNPYASCKRYKQIKGSSKSGLYNIDPRSNGVGFEVYCDMDTAGGGWTILVKNGDDTGTTVSEECSISHSIKDLDIEGSDYLIHCDLGQTKFLVHQPSDGWIVGSDGGEGQPNPGCAIDATKTGLNECDWLPSINTFDIIDASPSLKFLSPTVKRIWRAGDNNVHADSYLYNIAIAGGIGIGNSTSNASTLNGTVYNESPLGYIGVR